MKNTAHDIVAKLWNLCNVLKDDGVTYHQYVTELTYLLFLKMAKETNTEEQIPNGYRWNDLASKPTTDRLEFYKFTLIYLENHGSPIVKEIFSNAVTSIKKPNTLSLLVDGINKLDWYNADREDLGDIYEGLLEKNANEKKSGAGQYFTARPLIDSMVKVMKPTLDDVIQDPAAGTAGFLVAANHYIIKNSNPKDWTRSQKDKYSNNTFFGMEHVLDTHRLSLMNLFLHEIDFKPNMGGVRYGDTLSSDGEALPKATLVLSNPPFGTKKGGGLPERKDLPYSTSNKQLCFLQHIYLSIKPGGRAAVVLPDSTLFDGNIGRQIRNDLMNKCNLHTVLRLPTGIFYAQGVKTSVLFFTRGKTDRSNTKEVWVYDLRANVAQYGRRNMISSKNFTEFEIAFGNDPFGGDQCLSQRVDGGDNGRFRRFTREWISDRNDSLDISWLKDEGEALQEPAILVQEVMNELESAQEELRWIMSELGEEVEA